MILLTAPSPLMATWFLDKFKGHLLRGPLGNEGFTTNCEVLDFVG